MTSLSTQSRTEESTRQTATWAPLAVILCGTFVYVLDFFIVNVALPSVQSSLGASPAAIEWVVAGYGLTSASFLVTGDGSATTTAADDCSASGSRRSRLPRRCAPPRRTRAA